MEKALKISGLLLLILTGQSLYGQQSKQEQALAKGMEAV